MAEAIFAGSHIDPVKKIIKYVHETPSRGLIKRQLDQETLRIRVYTDSSFADNEDLTTQLRCIVLLCDSH